MIDTQEIDLICVWRHSVGMSGDKFRLRST